MTCAKTATTTRMHSEDRLITEADDATLRVIELSKTWDLGINLPEMVNDFPIVIAQEINPRLIVGEKLLQPIV